MISVGDHGVFVFPSNPFKEPAKNKHRQRDVLFYVRKVLRALSGSDELIHRK